MALQYFWIDSFCIIQDDKGDKSNQITQIPEIFSNAYVTICATNTSDCTQSFLDNAMTEDSFEGFEIPFTNPDGSYGQIVIQPSISFSMYSERAHRRA